MPHPDEYVSFEAWEKDRDTALQDITRIVEGVIGEDEEVPRPQDEESRDRFYRKSGQNFLRNQLKTNLRKVLEWTYKKYRKP